MAKRGETRPWRMTYQWPGDPKGTETHSTQDRARDAARRQVERISGMTGLRNCTATVMHRDAALGYWPESYRACPNCGHWTVWDTAHLPHAWRHEWDSRWCEPIEGSIEPTMPPGTTEAPEAVRLVLR